MGGFQAAFLRFKIDEANAAKHLRYATLHCLFAVFTADLKQQNGLKLK
jgi:hypothetical protein